jgi:hypothetical protein
MNRAVEIQARTRLQQIEHAVGDTMTLIHAYSGKTLTHAQSVQFVQSWNHIMASADLPIGTRVDIS